MKYISICLVTLLLFQCTTERKTGYVSYIENKSAHIILLSYYKAGLLSASKSVTVSPYIVKEVLSTGGMDAVSYPTEIMLNEFDSLVVTFSNKRTAVHYGYSKLGDNANAILFENPRNLFNKKNWIEKIIVDKRKRSEKEYRFIFVEQDYLNAQEL